MYSGGEAPRKGVLLGETQRTREEGQRVSSRKVPIPHLLVAGTTSGAADTLYTVRSGVIAEIKRLVVTNTSGTAATLTLHAVPSAGSIATANAELVGFSVDANKAVDLTNLIGGMYAQGTTLEAFAGTTNVLVVHGWVEEIL